MGTVEGVHREKNGFNMHMHGSVLLPLMVGKQVSRF